MELKTKSSSWTFAFCVLEILNSSLSTTKQRNSLKRVNKTTKKHTGRKPNNATFKVKLKCMKNSSQMEKQ